MNAVGGGGLDHHRPRGAVNDFSRGTPVRIGGNSRLAPWLAGTLANRPVGLWSRGYFEYPLRRPRD